MDELVYLFFFSSSSFISLFQTVEFKFIIFIIIVRFTCGIHVRLIVLERELL